MFLTKKAFVKILVMTIAYFLLGCFCFVAGILISCIDIDAGVFFVLGAICYSLCPMFVFWGRYAEGKGKWINLGNKLIRNDLKPQAFIEEYQRLRSSTDLVINQPSMEILQLVAMAYDSLDDRENCLAAADEIIFAASEKRKTLAKLIKASFLFSYDRIDEAEAVFTEARATKQDFVCQALTDAILKSDRAMALGDYHTVEAHILKMLSQTFPKPDRLSKLIYHYKLGEAYEKLQEYEKALSHYQYCVENGGETAMKASANSALLRLK